MDCEASSNEETLIRCRNRINRSRAQYEEKFVRWVLHGPPKHRQMSKKTQETVNAILRRHRAL